MTLIVNIYMFYIVSYDYRGYKLYIVYLLVMTLVMTSTWASSHWGQWLNPGMSGGCQGTMWENKLLFGATAMNGHRW